MKNWIKQQLKESLDEISTKQKNVFGAGAFHKVFKSEKYPDKLFKIGSKETVGEWIDIFRRYPKYFPKVYRVFPYSKNPFYNVVEIERLNTKQASMDLDAIDLFLYNNADNLQCNDEYLGKHNFFERGCFQQVKNLLIQQGKDELLALVIKWSEFLAEAHPIIDDELGTVTGSNNRTLDLHGGNVAYDNQGNIKLIDI